LSRLHCHRARRVAPRQLRDQGAAGSRARRSTALCAAHPEDAGGVLAADLGHARPARPSLHHRVRTHGKRDPHIRVRIAEQATARDRHQPRRLIEEVLAGTQVTLRPVRADDEAKLMEIFSDPEVARWWGDPAAHNSRAIKAYERVGFKPVGFMRQYERGPAGEWHDGLLMDMLADELRD